MDKEIVVVVDGVPAESAALREACQLAATDGRNLTVLMVHRPLGDWADGALMTAGINPGRFRLEVEMEQRSSIHEAIGEAGIGSGYQLEMIRRRCSEERLERLFGSSAAVVLPTKLTKLLRRIQRVAERAGLEPMIADEAKAAPLMLAAE
jgi:nucleotide-binding universal stress UspA family protein